MPNIKDLFSERIVEGALSYQVPPEADNLDWWKHLINECAENSVTLVSPMVGQDSICEPFNHWGLDYPSEIYKKWCNPTCRNADPGTEYLSELISYAHGRGIKVYPKLMTLGVSWIYAEHPEWLQKNSDGFYVRKLCPDKEEARKAVIRYVLEFVKRYGGKKLNGDAMDGLYFDHHGYTGAHIDVGSSCSCSDTQKAFWNTFDEEWDKASEEKRSAFRSQSIAKFSKNLVEGIKSINPNIEVGATDVELHWGHLPEVIRTEKSGLEFVHVQYLARPDKEKYASYTKKVESYCRFFDKVWLQFDCRTPVPWTVATLARFWTSVPSMYTMMEMAGKLREEINHSEHLVGISFFNISAVPENHPNRRAMFRCLNYELPGL